MNPLVSLVLNFTDNSHPKVVYSSLTCLGMLCEEFAPEI